MLLAAVVFGLVLGAAAEPVVEWESLAPGIELTRLTAEHPSHVGDSKIVVVRIDPGTWQLDLIGRSRSGEKSSLSAREWAEANHLAVAINAGMFALDYKTHSGYMECRGHVNSSRTNGYQSVAAFDPRDPEQPLFRIFDLDEPGVSIQTIKQDYASLVQNLRLVQKPGANRWSKQDKKWSEAALGEDADGKILFVFSRSPFSMRDFNTELLSAGIGLVALQHLEGGPEAQLYLKVGDTELEFVGSYETSFRDDDSNARAWPVPNVLGVRPRAIPRRD